MKETTAAMFAIMFGVLLAPGPVTGYAQTSVSVDFNDRRGPSEGSGGASGRIDNSGPGSLNSGPGSLHSGRGVGDEMRGGERGRHSHGDDMRQEDRRQDRREDRQMNRREDRQADRREDRRNDGGVQRGLDRADAVAGEHGQAGRDNARTQMETRAERSSHLERVERPERPSRSDRLERMDRMGR